MQSARLKLKRCQQALTTWSSTKLRNSTKIIEKKTKQLERLQRDEDPGSRDQILKLQREIDLLLEMEDIRWKQRAKRHWFGPCDRNTQFFHAWATHRRKKNHIDGIWDEHGSFWSKPKDVDTAFIRYFQSLFTSAHPIGVDESLVNVHP